MLWKWQYYPMQSTDSMQSLSNYQQHFSQNKMKIFHNLYGNTKTPNSQRNLKKEEWSWRNQLFLFQTILQSYSHQDSMVLAQKQKYRPVEQDRTPGHKPMHLQTTYLWQGRQEYTMDKVRSLQYMLPGKLDSHVIGMISKYQKNDIRILPKKIHKDKLKMD